MVCVCPQDRQNYRETFGGALELINAGWRMERAVPEGTIAAIDQAERELSLATSSQELVAAAEKLFKLLPVAEHKATAAKVCLDAPPVLTLSFSLSLVLPPSLPPSLPVSHVLIYSLFTNIFPSPVDRSRSWLCDL